MGQYLYPGAGSEGGRMSPAEESWYNKSDEEQLRMLTGQTARMRDINASVTKNWTNAFPGQAAKQQRDEQLIKMGYVPIYQAGNIARFENTSGQAFNAVTNLPQTPHDKFLDSVQSQRNQVAQTQKSFLPVSQMSEKQKMETSFNPYFINQFPAEAKVLQGRYGGGANKLLITSGKGSTEQAFYLAAAGVGLEKARMEAAIKILFSKPITEAASSVINKIIPVQNKGFAVSSLPAQAGRAGLFVASLPFTGASYMTEFAKGLLTDPLGTIQQTYKYAINNPYEVAGITAGGLTTAKTRTNAKEISLFGKKPFQLEPTAEMIKAVEPFSRQRATLILKDEQGNVILGKTKSGEYISIGGGIEKGQTPRAAALAELKQETGLTIKDINGFKSAGKVTFPEETHNLFTGVIDPNKIIPSSDITDWARFNPEKALGKTGQTSTFPIDRYFLDRLISPTGKLQSPIGKLRSYEYGIINYLETGQKPTWLVADTKLGKFVLGTQSRYNVPYSSQKEFLKQEELLLAHGTPNPAILRKLLSFGEKEFKVKGELTKRGAKEGLYVQPPISADKIFMQEIIKRQGKEYPLKIRVPKFDITKLATWKYKIKGIQPGTFYKWGGEQGGYIGLSYLGFKTSQIAESLGYKFESPKATAYLFKEKNLNAISETPKTKTGMEEELTINPNTKISTVGRAEVFSIGLKKVFLQQSKILEKGLETETKKTLASISKEQGYTSIAPSQVLSLVKTPQPSQTEKAMSDRINSSFKAMSDSINKSFSSAANNLSSVPSVSVSKPSMASTPASFQKSVASEMASFQRSISSITTPPSKPSSSNKASSKSSYPSYSGSSSILPPNTIKEIMSPLKIYNLPGTQQQKPKSLGVGYWVYGKIIKTNKFQKLNSVPVTHTRAQDIGAYYVTQSVARTYKINKAGKSAEQDNMAIPFGYYDMVKYQLREFKISNKKVIETPETFIQKNPYLLSSAREKAQIKAFQRQAAQIMNF